MTLPKPVRERCGLRTGDRLDCIAREDGLIEIIPLKQPASKLRGILPKLTKPVTVEDMNKAIAKGAFAHGGD